jgi:hypothetical protein
MYFDEVSIRFTPASIAATSAARCSGLLRPVRYPPNPTAETDSLVFPKRR